MFDATREKTRLWLLILVGVVATLLGQTHAREIFAPSPHESGVFAKQTQASTGENYDGIQYDALDSLLAANRVANQIPSTMARVIPDTPITRASGTLGKAGDSDVFVTAAGDIRGLNAQQISQRLTIPQSPTGFRVIEFPTPGSGVASPVFRSDPGFIGGGRTLGGAREFVIPNGTIPAGSRTTIIGP